MQASKYLITLAFVLATAVHAAAEDWVLIETKTAEANGTHNKRVTGATPRRSSAIRRRPGLR